MVSKRQRAGIHKRIAGPGLENPQRKSSSSRTGGNSNRNRGRNRSQRGNGVFVCGPEHWIRGGFLVVVVVVVVAEAAARTKTITAATGSKTTIAGVVGVVIGNAVPVSRQPATNTRQEIPATRLAVVDSRRTVPRFAPRAIPKGSQRKGYSELSNSLT